jgi:hypothetical protein
VREVQACAGDVVLGLTDVHPETSEVIRVQLLVGGDSGEDLLFDGGGAELCMSAGLLEVVLIRLGTGFEGALWGLKTARIQAPIPGDMVLSSEICRRDDLGHRTVPPSTESTEEP